MVRAVLKRLAELGATVHPLKDYLDSESSPSMNHLEIHYKVMPSSNMKPSRWPSPEGQHCQVSSE